MNIITQHEYTTKLKKCFLSGDL